MKKTTTGPINFNELNEITGGNQEIMLACFKKFLEILPDKIRDIKYSIKNKNFQKLNYSSHSLKNSLNFLAAEYAGKLAYELERLSENKNIENIDKLFNELNNECNKLSNFINDYLSKNDEVLNE